MHADPAVPPFTYLPIGTIRSPFHDTAGMPIQPNGARGVRGTVDIFGKYREGLSDLDGFARIILIYAFHKCTDHCLTVTPFLDTTARGVFATRSPRRPNAIGLSVHPAHRGEGHDPGGGGRGRPRRYPAPRHQAICARVRLVPRARPAAGWRRSRGMRRRPGRITGSGDALPRGYSSFRNPYPFRRRTPGDMP